MTGEHKSWADFSLFRRERTLSYIVVQQRNGRYITFEKLLLLLGRLLILWSRHISEWRPNGEKKNEKTSLECIYRKKRFVVWIIANERADNYPRVAAATRMLAEGRLFFSSLCCWCCNNNESRCTQKTAPRDDYTSTMIANDRWIRRRTKFHSLVIATYTREIEWFFPTTKSKDLNKKKKNQIKFEFEFQVLFFGGRWWPPCRFHIR